MIFVRVPNQNLRVFVSANEAISFIEHNGGKGEIVMGEFLAY